MPTRQEGRSAGHGTAGSGQGGNASARRDRPCAPRGSIGRVLGGGSKEKQDTAEVRLRSRERIKKEEKVLRTARERREKERSGRAVLKPKTQTAKWGPPKRGLNPPLRGSSAAGASGTSGARAHGEAGTVIDAPKARSTNIAPGPVTEGTRKSRISRGVRAPFASIADRNTTALATEEIQAHRTRH